MSCFKCIGLWHDTNIGKINYSACWHEHFQNKNNMWLKVEIKKLKLNYVQIKKKNYGFWK